MNTIISKLIQVACNDGEVLAVQGKYHGSSFTGTVVAVRPKYGTNLAMTITLDNSITVFGTERSEIIMDTGDLVCADHDITLI